MAADVKQVKRSDAVALFEAMGFKMAGKWGNDKLAANLAKLGDFIDDEAELGDDQEALAVGIMEAIDAGDGIEVVDGTVGGGPEDIGEGREEPEIAKPVVEVRVIRPPEKPKPGRKAKKTKEAGKVKTEKKTDKFGNRLGTKAAKFCACLSGEPKTMRDLLGEAGDTVTCYNLLNRLIGKGLVIKEGRGYSTSS